MKIPIKSLTLLILFTLSMLVFGCQQDTDTQTSKILADMKSQLELLKNQKTETDIGSIRWQQQMSSLAESMKQLTDAVDALKTCMPNAV